MREQLKYGIYIISQPVGIMYTSSKHSKIDNVSKSYLCNCKLGYMNKNRIDGLIKKHVLNIDDCESLPTYESCLLDKMIKSTFKEKSERARDVLGLIDIDVCGSMNIGIRGGYNYFIIFTDDLSRYGYVYLMKHKSESFEIFK